MIAKPKRHIPLARPELTSTDTMSVARSVDSGWISGRGPDVERFEKAFAKWLGAKYAIAVSSGTAALHLALVSVGIRPGDEVIIPAFSMAAIPFAVSYTGARIVLVDSEPDYWCIEPQQIEQKITPRTKAIVIMHAYGHPCEMQPILECAEDHQIPLIEDAAEAHGAEYNSRKVGTLGDLGCFSFFANKIITTGEGGMVTTGDEQVAKQVRALRDMAFEPDIRRKFVHRTIGFNYRLTNMQAALGLSQLERVDDFIARRRRAARLYNELLTPMKHIQLHHEASWAKNVYWMYSILTEDETDSVGRDLLMRRLWDDYQIESRPFFVPVHKQPVYSNLHLGEQYPVSERISRSGLNLPSGNTLTNEEVEYVAGAIGSILSQEEVSAATTVQG